MSDDINTRAEEPQGVETRPSIEETTAPQKGKSPWLAALLGLIPGAGHIYSGATSRGVALLFFIPTMVGLSFWRRHVAEINPLAGISEELLILLLAIMGVVYIWSIWDAYRTAAGRPMPLRLLLVLGALVTYIIGWDVTEINLQKAVSEIGDVIPRLSQLAWPWDEAFVRGVEVTEARAPVEVPCDETPPLPPEEIPGEPYIMVSPRCGEESGPVSPTGQRQLGTELQVIGRGFRPGEEADVIWRDPIGNEYRPRATGEVVKVVPNENGSFAFTMVIPSLIMPEVAEGVQTHYVIVRQEREVGELRPSRNLLLALEKMAETIFLGLMATTFGIVLAIPVSFVAARNLMSGSTVTMVIYYVVRFILNIVRSIEPLIWALIAVIWVGLGPFAGVIALTLHSIAALGKLYSEAIESIDPGPIEAIQATGANPLQVVVYAVIPQVIPPFVSFTIYRWDINVRMSTIIGAVGGGGIGFLLMQWIKLSDYDAAGIAVWFIAITVSILDYVSAQIREQFV